MTPDPFERAVERERKLRRKADIFTGNTPALIRLVMLWYAGGFVLWGLVLTAHWVFFSEVRWLLLTHTLIFALVFGYALVVGSFVLMVKRRRPDFFDR